MYSVRLKDFCMDKIALKTFISQNMKKTEQHNYLSCEFTKAQCQMRKYHVE